MTSLEIAKDLLSEVTKGNYLPFLLLFICAPILSAISSITSYFKTRSKLKAEFETFNKTLENEIKKIEDIEKTKIDIYNGNFKILAEQQQKLTRQVETVKAEISKKDWAEREWKSIKVKKIEELMNLTRDSKEWLETKRNMTIDGVFFEKICPYDSIETIATLYLPELSKSANNYVTLCREISQFLSTKFLEIRQIEKEADESQDWNMAQVKHEKNRKLKIVYENMVHPKSGELHLLQLKIAEEGRALVEKLFLHSE